jgi:nucleotide-binding universal stress UspA family protein
MEKSILVALDDSPRAHGVLDNAIAFARALGQKLVLLRVMPLPVVQLSPEGLPLGVDMQGELERHARHDLEKLLARVPADVPARAMTILDTPWQGIVEAAKKEDVSLIVVGSHSLRVLDRLLGTTAAKVVNHADRSVLVVREPEPEAV